MKHSNKLKQLFQEGNIGDLAIGKKLITSEGEWISSVALHSNGLPVLYKCFLDDFAVNVVVDEANQITGLVVHLMDFEDTLQVNIDERSIAIRKETTLDELLRFLNLSNLDWGFQVLAEKIICVTLAKSRLQLIFCYYPEQSNELQLIQVEAHL